MIKGQKLVGAGDFHVESQNKLLVNTGVESASVVGL